VDYYLEKMYVIISATVSMQSW